MRRQMLLFLLALPCSVMAAESTCYGTPNKGRLEDGVRITESGINFGSYSGLGVSIGRTYVHSKVALVISAAYASLAQSRPNTFFVYGESGWANGGSIKPHRTHQNGLAVDFMVPVLTPEGKSVPLPTSVTNKFGYNIEFDSAARYHNLTIDFEAIGEHLFALHMEGQKQGIGIARVIFDPAFLPRLYRTKHGTFLKQKITFMQQQAWVRHDEHYHVDFSVPCKPLKG